MALESVRGIWWTDESGEITICLSSTQEKPLSQNFKIFHPDGLSHEITNLTLTAEHLYIVSIPLSQPAPPYLLISCPWTKGAVTLTQVDNLNRELTPLYLSRPLRGFADHPLFVTINSAISEVSKATISTILARIHSL